MNISALALLLIGLTSLGQAATVTRLYTASTPLSPGFTWGLSTYGSSFHGGGFNADGTLWRYNNGNLKNLHSFGVRDGAYPNAALGLNAQGTLFGSTEYGGLNGTGTLFSYGADGTYTVLHSSGHPPFVNGVLDGSSYRGGVIGDGSGDFFGVAERGGLGYPGGGVIFEYSSGGVYSVVHAFDPQTESALPQATPYRHVNGDLTGALVGGSGDGRPNTANPFGALYIYHWATATLQILYAYKDGSDGEWPLFGMAYDGTSFYVTTTFRNGGLDYGTIGALTAGNYTVLHHFTGTPDGAEPDGPLLYSSVHGGVFGVTLVGGASNKGTLFEIKNGVYSVVCSFTGSADGSYPTGSIAEDAAGNLYVGTAEGYLDLITGL